MTAEAESTVEYESRTNSSTLWAANLWFARIYTSVRPAGEYREYSILVLLCMARLTDLPNELLDLIVRELIRSSWIPDTDFALWPLIKVNRRLASVTLPYIEHHVRFHAVDDDDDDIETRRETLSYLAKNTAAWDRVVVVGIYLSEETISQRPKRGSSVPNWLDGQSALSSMLEQWKDIGDHDIWLIKFEDEWPGWTQFAELVLLVFTSCNLQTLNLTSAFQDELDPQELDVVVLLQELLRKVQLAPKQWFSKLRKIGLDFGHQKRNLSAVNFCELPDLQYVSLSSFDPEYFRGMVVLPQYDIGSISLRIPLGEGEDWLRFLKAFPKLQRLDMDDEQCDFLLYDKATSQFCDDHLTHFTFDQAPKEAIDLLQFVDYPRLTRLTFKEESFEDQVLVPQSYRLTYRKSPVTEIHLQKLYYWIKIPLEEKLSDIAFAISYYQRVFPRLRTVTLGLPGYNWETRQDDCEKLYQTLRQEFKGLIINPYSC